MPCLAARGWGSSQCARIETACAAAGLPVTVHAAESFLDAVFCELGVDPLQKGFKLLDGHDLPDPLVFDVPTVIGHVGLPEILADVLVQVDRVIPDDQEICVLAGLGAPDAQIVWGLPAALGRRPGRRAHFGVRACRVGRLGRGGSRHGASASRVSRGIASRRT